VDQETKILQYQMNKAIEVIVVSVGCMLAYNRLITPRKSFSNTNVGRAWPEIWTCVPSKEIVLFLDNDLTPGLNFIVKQLTGHEKRYFI
jgi:hypothetical protein